MRYSATLSTISGRWSVRVIVLVEASAKSEVIASDTKPEPSAAERGRMNRKPMGSRGQLKGGGIGEGRGRGSPSSEMRVTQSDD